MDRTWTAHEIRGSFLRLQDADLEILIALADGEAHGYAIMDELERLSTLVRHGRRRMRLLPSGGRS